MTQLARSLAQNVVSVSTIYILSLFTAIKGFLSEFGVFSFGLALSSQPTPYQVLKQKCQKLHKDNDDDSTEDSLLLRITFTF